MQVFFCNVIATAVTFFVIRSLSPELQEGVIRVLTNGNLLLKAAKQFVGQRTSLSQQQIAGLPTGLNSQVWLL